MAEIHGTVEPRFEEVRRTFERHLDAGEDVGGSVAVFLRGEPVVDIWGGFRDEARTVPWTRDTLVNVWSTTKTMTFLVALMLHDRGELDFSAPVCRYWPEFAQNGKEAIEVRHLMAHSAGLPAWDPPFAAEDLANWDYACERLAAQKPWWDDRTVSGYHAVTQGFLIGEVVRRITGTSIGRFFKSEVADVLGADFHIGLPESEESRVSLVIPPGPMDTSVLADFPMALRTFTSPLLDGTMPHHRWWRAAEIPAANGHGNAYSVGVIQQIIANNGHANGHRFFSESTGDLIFERQNGGVDLCLGIESNFGLGYGLSSPTTPLGPRACFWGGFGGSVIIMDQDLGLTVSYMMNRMHPTLVGDTRGAELALAAVTGAFS